MWTKNKSNRNVVECRTANANEEYFIYNYDEEQIKKTENFAFVIGIAYGCRAYVSEFIESINITSKYIYYIYCSVQSICTKSKPHRNSRRIYSFFLVAFQTLYRQQYESVYVYQSHKCLQLIVVWSEIEKQFVCNVCRRKARARHKARQYFCISICICRIAHE